MEQKHSREELYRNEYIAFFIANEECGISIEDWASERGLDLGYLKEIGIGMDESIPAGTSIRKQREDFVSSFETRTMDTEITPIIRKEMLKEEERIGQENTPEKSGGKPRKKRGRPRKVSQGMMEMAAGSDAETPEKTETTAEGMPEERTVPDNSLSSLQAYLQNVRILREKETLFVIAFSDEAYKALVTEENRVIEIIRQIEGFRGKISIVRELPKPDPTVPSETIPDTEKAAEDTKPEKKLEEEKEMKKMSEEEKKPSFLMMDGKAVLEDEGFHMELSVDVTDAEEIKAKIDLLYSSYGKFREIMGNR